MQGTSGRQVVARQRQQQHAQQAARCPLHRRGAAVARCGEPLVVADPRVRCGGARNRRDGARGLRGELVGNAAAEDNRVEAREMRAQGGRARDRRLVEVCAARQLPHPVGSRGPVHDGDGIRDEQHERATRVASDAAGNDRQHGRQLAHQRADGDAPVGAAVVFARGVLLERGDEMHREVHQRVQVHHNDAAGTGIVVQLCIDLPKKDAPRVIHGTEGRRAPCALDSLPLGPPDLLLVMVYQMTDRSRAVR